MNFYRLSLVAVLAVSVSGCMAFSTTSRDGRYKMTELIGAHSCHSVIEDRETGAQKYATCPGTSQVVLEGAKVGAQVTSVFGAVTGLIESGPQVVVGGPVAVSNAKAKAGAKAGAESNVDFDPFNKDH